ncbi:MAG: Txe/YoeB family addiction module toxin [Pyrinomonadaceae bacterium]|nr:Txe/YoeB family addiction module toxin [Pyrinomonadaceae bacterium]
MNGAKSRDSVFEPEFRDDLSFWLETNRKTLIRIFELVEAVMRDPFKGIGKPEPMRHLGSNIWSRRITKEHRMLYRVTDERVNFLQARFHY